MTLGAVLAIPAWAVQGPAMEHALVPDKPGGAAPISQSVLAEKYGVQIVHIAVTAGGGMVDFRFKILDPDKAKQVVKDRHHPPALVAEDSGLRLNAPEHMLGNVRLKKDAVCFILYPNARSALRSGTPVSALFGEVRVEPIKAQ